MAALLDEPEIATYDATGFLILRAFSPPSEIDLLRRLFDRVFILRDEGDVMRDDDDRGLNLERLYDPAREFPELRDTSFYRCGCAIASELLRVSPESVTGILLFIRKPARGAGTLWHQHTAQRRPSFVHHDVTLWMPLDECSAERGCLKVVPGSHVDAPYVHDAVNAAIADDEIDRARVRLCPLQAGEVLAIHESLAHGSEPNQTLTARAAVALFAYC